MEKLHGIEILYRLLEGFPGSTDNKKYPCNAGNPSLIPGSGRFPKGMATHSNILAWKIPWTEEPGGLPTWGLRVRPNRAANTWASLVVQSVRNLPAVQEIWVQSLDDRILWGREWQPIPLFLPGELFVEQRT